MGEEKKNDGQQQEQNGGQQQQQQEQNKQKEGAAGSQQQNQQAGSGSGDKMFSQAELDRIATREKDQGRRSVMQELGLTGDSDISKLRALLDSQKTDEQKKAEEDAQRQELEAKAARAEAKVEAFSYDVKKDCVDEVVDLALVKVANGNVDFKTAVGEIKTKFPNMFNSAGDEEDDKKKKEEEKKKTGQKGTGGNVGASGSSGDAGGAGGSGGVGARLAAKRKTANNQKDAPYWKRK